jgi:ParB family transcriptional regulator, chromosome partitioning protein
MTTIQMVPISQIRLLNPRARGKAKFSDIVSNIAAVGLKKPITVAPREEEPGTYDLVCGQGRLEAYQSLGQTEVPALVRDVPRHDRYIMSLVENIARCRTTSMALVRELSSLRDRGYTQAQSAAKVGISDGYVTMLLRLIDNGEERLIGAVERGEIPIAVAIEIASSDDAAIQQSLAEAYTTKQLRGKALLAARRLVEERRAIGKTMRTGGRKERPKVTTEEVVKTYRKEIQRQRQLAKKARATELRLVFIASALKKLLADENFVNLLRAEKLDNLPEYLADTIRRTG